jgi:hypothetical protein
MIDTDKKYEGHTPANEWRLVFTEGRLGKDKQMLGFSIEVHDLHQLQACDPDLYLIAEANHALAQDAPLLLAEVTRLREQNEYFRGLLDHYKGELIDEHAEVKRLREGIKDYLALHMPSRDELRELIE